MPPEQRNAAAVPVAVAEPGSPPEPLRPTIPDALLPYVDASLGDARYREYPRTGGRAWLRDKLAALRLPTLIATYVVYVATSLITDWLNGQALGAQDILRTLLFGRLVELWQTQPMLAAPISLAVIIIFIMVFILAERAHADRLREAQILALRDEWKTWEAQARRELTSLSEVSSGGQRQHTFDIFISSTSRDLGLGYRPAVRRALETLRQHPRMMEDFGAQAGDATQVSTAEVAAADLVLLIVAWRYGYVPEGETRSVTHLEYLEARRLGKPVLVFLAAPETEARDNPFPHDQRDPEHAAQLAAFRAELERSHVAAYFTTPDELERAVIKALHTWLRRQPVGQEQVERALGEAAPAGPSGPPFEEGALLAATEFIGRAEDVAWVMARLTTPHEGERIGLISAIGGLGGIGKTALAAEAIRRLRARGHFADGVVVVIAAGQTDARALLREALSHFDPRVPAEATLPQLASAARSLLDSKDALIVLDNMEPELDAQQVIGPLAATGVALLLTARQVIPTLPAGATRQLDVLPSDEARDLFAVSWRDVRAEALSAEERATVGRIVEELGRHTLAVKLAGAYARKRELAAVARELANPQRALDLAVPGVTEGVRRAFETSYLALDDDARRLFAGLGALADYGRQAVEAKVLGAFAGTNYGRRAVLALAAGLGLEHPEAAVDTLVYRALADAATDETLPEKADRERLRLHPLARAYAEGLFARMPEADRDAATLALAGFYAEYIAEVGLSAIHPLVLDEESIVAALEWAHAQGQDALVVRLCYGMDQFWRDTGRTRASLRYLPWGVAAAEAQLGAPPDSDDDAAVLTTWRERAHILFWLLLNDGRAFEYTGQLDEAERRYQRCLALARQAGDRQHEGVALSVLGQIAQARGRLEDAERYLQQSLVIARETGNGSNEGAVLSHLGQIAQARGRLEDAERYLQQSLVARREVQDRQGEAVDLANLGALAKDRGKLEEAERYYTDALIIARDIQDRRSEGGLISELGQIAARRGRLDEAERYLQQSLAIRREVQDRRGEGVVLASLGQIAQQRGWLDEAEDRYQQGLAMLREAQDALNVATLLGVLGAFLISKRGKREEGCAMLAEAATLYEGMGLAERAEAARERARRLGCG